MEQRCYGCMEIKYSSPICEHCGFDDRQRNEPDRLPMGTVLRGQYLVGRTLGQGGFGITYIGWDLLLNIPIAIKEFFPRGVVMRDCTMDTKVRCYTDVQQAFGKSKERFLREAQTLARFMSIPEIVRIQNFFEENDTAYIVMEYVKGMNLHQYMAKCGGRLSVEKTLELLKPVMEALIQVHKANIVHRDISPDNIMLIDGNRTKLLDFGAVREISDPTANGMLSHSTQAILKHGFAPVEQYRSRGALGPWTDVYALCATIYCCLTGRVPEESQELMLEGRRINWRSIPGLNQRQIDALEYGTQLLPNQRMASVQELYDALYTQKRVPVYTAPVWQPVQGGVTVPLEENPRSVHNPVDPAGVTAPVNRSYQPEEPVKPPVQPVEPVKKPSEKPTPVPAKKGKRKLILLILLFMLGCFTWAQVSGENPTTKYTPAPSQADPGVELSHANTLMENSNKSSYALEDMAKEPAFNTTAKRGEVATITFLSDISQAPMLTKDASWMGNNQVKAWVEKNGKLYDLYIAADGGVYAPEDSQNLFAGMNQLTEIRFAGAFHTDDVKIMKGMFFGCKNLTAVDVSGFDTSSVTNMRGIFEECKALKTLDLSNFDTSNVTDMWSMFSECESLTQVNLTGFDTSAATGMRYMFYHCKSLQSVDLSMFNTANVTDMLFLFTNCESLTELDVSSFDTSNVKEMGWMFGNCYNLEKLNLGEMKTGSALNMENMFYCCEKLESVDVSSFDTSNVMDMSGMFCRCKSLKALDVSGWNTAKVTDMMGMFSFCQSLTKLDLRSFNTTDVRNMQNMFYSCSSLTNLNISSFKVFEDTDTALMFYDCPAAKPGWYQE